jgi:hypothetical protein
LDDELMAVVGKSLLHDDKRIQCVRGPEPDSAPSAISEWLLGQLRRQRRSLKRCPDGEVSPDPTTELWLGPVVWQIPGIDGTVYWGSRIL